MARLPAAEQMTALFEHEEAGREPPDGPALDLGCGMVGAKQRLA
jgi:hypothetical protein